MTPQTVEPGSQVSLKGYLLLAFINAGLAPAKKDGYDVTDFNAFWREFNRLCPEYGEEPVQPLGVASEVRADKQGHNADKQGDRKLKPRSARVFTAPFILQLLLTAFLCILLGGLLAHVL